MVNVQLKTIVSDINKLLKRNYNLISFDSLTPEQLLQVLTDVLGEIDSQNKVDIRHEELEDTAIRILEMLRILKYKLSPGMTPSLFRQGLIQGDVKVIHPILEWLLSNIEELKKRSYLAQYLVKLDVPPEILSDPDIALLYEQYEAQIEEFKASHKVNEALKDASSSVAELRNDISAMEGEKDIVLKKIEKLRLQVENIPGITGLLQSVQKLRQEKEREKELSVQREEHTSRLLTNDQRLRRMQTQLKELKQAAIGASPQSLLRRLQEECSVNTYIAKQKLPQEIAAREMEVRILENVLSEPNITRADIDDLNSQIQRVSSEINEMVERHLATQNPSEDKNAPIRQQSSIIGRKKENKAEQLGELRTQLSTLEEEFDEKKNQLKEVAGDTILKGEEFKRYVNKLKARSSVYKQHRAELASLKAEAGVLTRTLEILSSKDKSVLEAIAAEESRHGISGYKETKKEMEKVTEAEADLDSLKGKTLEEMSNLVTQLSRKVASKKTQLAPLISELKPLREELRELTGEYEEKKRIYEATSSGLENSTAKLQEEVEKLRSEIEETEKKITELESENKRSKQYVVKVAEEMKIYVSGNSANKKQSLREQLNQKISEQEKISKQLKEEQRLVKEDQTNRALQVQYWKDLETLMICKRQCLEESRKNSGVVRREKGAETLILS